jgi:hypothetical protein
MAKLQYGAVISDSRGSIEGVTFSKGRFGAFARRRVIPVGRQTSDVTQVRGWLANLSRRWYGTLNQAARDDWIALAAANPVTDVFGNSHALTGQQFYIRVNQIRFSAGLAVLDAAPADQSVTGLDSFTLTATAPATLSIAFTTSPLSAGHRLYMWATPSLSPGRVATRRDMKFIGVSAAAQTTPYAAGAQYAARFGDMVSGRLITVEVCVLRDDRGALSPYFSDSDEA